MELSFLSFILERFMNSLNRLIKLTILNRLSYFKVMLPYLVNCSSKPKYHRIIFIIGDLMGLYEPTY